MSVNEIKSYYQVNGKWEECEFLSGEEMAQRSTELLRENNRLNNIINELEKWLNDEIYRHEEVYKPSNHIFIENGELHKVLDKLKELKEKK